MTIRPLVSIHSSSNKSMRPSFRIVHLPLNLNPPIPMRFTSYYGNTESSRKNFSNLVPNVTDTNRRHKTIPFNRTTKQTHNRRSSPQTHLHKMTLSLPKQLNLPVINNRRSLMTRTSHRINNKSIIINKMQNPPPKNMWPPPRKFAQDFRDFTFPTSDDQNAFFIGLGCGHVP
ncbi:Uncharacterised protein [uncultured archaeon]|nr:Uncharacterised protein [uncultured archaeon]